MDCRAHEEAHGPYYAVFENRHPDGDFGSQATEERQPALAAVTEVFGKGGIIATPEPDEPGLLDLPKEGLREESSKA